jgi:hypothetical protein
MAWLMRWPKNRALKVSLGIWRSLGETLRRHVRGVRVTTACDPELLGNSPTFYVSVIERSRAAD